MHAIGGVRVTRPLVLCDLLIFGPWQRCAPGASSAPPLRNSHVELDLPLGLARFGPRVSDVSLVSAGEGVAAGFIPAIENDPVVAGPLDESLVGAPGVIDVSKCGVSACWQHASPDPVIALELCRRDDTYFEVHRTFHVYDAQAQEERTGPVRGRGDAP